MTTTIVPCKRPKVDVEPHVNGAAGAFSARCRVPGCSWSYGTTPYQAVKTDAEQQATRHRAEHRDAVPLIQVDKLNGGGYRASCECRAIASERPLTRTDVDAWVAYHLSTHGVVTCS